MMEGAIGFGAATIRILLPGFVAAGVGYVVFVGFGDWGGLHAQAISSQACRSTQVCTSPTPAVAVGTAAGMAAVTRMLLTPILFAALLVGPAGVDAVPAAVVAAAAAWLVIATLERRRKAQEATVAEPVPATTG